MQKNSLDIERIIVETIWKYSQYNSQGKGVQDKKLEFTALKALAERQRHDKREFKIFLNFSIAETHMIDEDHM